MGGKDHFILAGGGAAGAYQVGCLKAIFERSTIRPAQIFANSAGALNGACLTYAGVQDLELLWLGIKSRKDLFGNRFMGWLTPLFGALSLWDSKPLEKMLDEILKWKTPMFPLTVNYVDLSNGTLLRAKAGDVDFKKHLLASASLPILTPPVEGKFCDGGIRENTPLRPAIEAGAERIFVFLNSPEHRKLPKIEKFSGVKELAARVLAILSDEVYWEDIHYCKEQEDAQVIYFAPKISTIDTLDFEPAKIKKAILQGYIETVETLEKFNLLKEEV